MLPFLALLIVVEGLRPHTVTNLQPQTQAKIESEFNAASAYLGCFPVDASSVNFVITISQINQEGASSECVSHCLSQTWPLQPLSVLTKGNQCGCLTSLPSAPQVSASNCNQTCFGAVDCDPSEDPQLCCGDSTGSYYSILVAGVDPISFVLTQLEWYTSGSDPATDKSIMTTLFEESENSQDLMNLLNTCYSQCANPHTLFTRFIHFNSQLYCKWPDAAYSNGQGICGSLQANLDPFSFAWNDATYTTSLLANTSTPTVVGDTLLCDASKSPTAMTCNMQYTVTATTSTSWTFTGSVSVTVTATAKFQENAIVEKVTNEFSIAATLAFSTAYSNSNSHEFQSSYAVSVRARAGQTLALQFLQTWTTEVNTVEAQLDFSQNSFALGSIGSAPVSACNLEICPQIFLPIPWFDDLPINAALPEEQAFVPYYGIYTEPSTPTLSVSVIDINSQQSASCGQFSAGINQAVNCPGVGS